MSVKRTVDYWVLKKRADIVKIITFGTKYSINFAQNITIILSHLSNCRVGSFVRQLNVFWGIIRKPLLNSLWPPCYYLLREAMRIGLIE